MGFSARSSDLRTRAIFARRGLAARWCERKAAEVIKSVTARTRYSFLTANAGQSDRNGIGSWLAGQA